MGRINVNQTYTKWVIGMLLHFSFQILNFPVWVLRKAIKVVTKDLSKSEYDSGLLKIIFFSICGPYLAIDLSKMYSLF